MLTRGRVLTVLGVLLVAIVAYGAWQAWSLYRDLDRVEQSADELRAALDSGDDEARDRAIADLQDSADSASGNASSVWWDILSKLPVLGDDVEGLQVLSTTVDDVANEGLAPLADSLDRLDEVSNDGRVDVDVVRSMQDPVASANEVIGAASREVNGLDSGGFLGSLRTRYERYADILHDAASSLASADTAVRALPDMVGADGPRNYLLLFQNNAEIRATGGMPGSWAQIHAEDGRLEMTQQGTASDFPHTEDPVLPLTDEEVEIYGEEIGTYFQDPGFAPDFPRAAEIWRAHWDGKFPDTPIDGVLALDPVGMSYLLGGTGPVQVAGRTLTEDNLVEELLSRPYQELEEEAQDALFQDAARAIFDAVTGDLASPVDFVDGLSRATREGRFLVGPFDEEDAEILAGSNVLGEFRTGATDTPYVDIGLNDATGSKMSYYLRSQAEIESRSCKDDRQQLEASLKLGQVITPGAAAKLPDSVTGGGIHTTEPGSQLVVVRLYGPVGGILENVVIDGHHIDIEGDITVVGGRPVTTLAVILETRDPVVLTWSMESGTGQTGDVELAMTPGVLPGNENRFFDASC